MRVSMTWVALSAVLAGSSLTGCEFHYGTPPKVAAPPPVPKAVDTDGDGIQDRDDKCPKEKEDNKAPLPNDGCLTTDGDGDGVAGTEDKCPDKAGTAANHGCPEEKPAPPPPKKVVVTDTKVDVTEEIKFEKDKAEISPDSFPIIKEVAEVLKEHADINLVEVAGHASKESKESDAGYNKTLSQHRVDAVVAKLVEFGVDKSRLVAHGYGFYCPKVADAAAPENRRVEFEILYKATKSIAKTIGCDAAKKAGIDTKIPAYKAPPKAAATPAKPTAAAPATTPAAVAPAAAAAPKAPAKPTH